MSNKELKTKCYSNLDCDGNCYACKLFADYAEEISSLEEDTKSKNVFL